MVGVCREGEDGGKGPLLQDRSVIFFPHDDAIACADNRDGMTGREAREVAKIQFSVLPVILLTTYLSKPLDGQCRGLKSRRTLGVLETVVREISFEMDLTETIANFFSGKN